MRKKILDTLEKHFQSQIDRHRINVEVMLENPRAIHEHTDIMAAIEKEIAHISEYEDKLHVLNKFFNQEGDHNYVD
jgi:septum formation topological specificity factor MinE